MENEVPNATSGSNSPAGGVGVEEQTAEAQGGDYKPNIYQLIFWALTYGAVAGVGLFVLRLVSNYLGLLWGPVFLAALIWGGYRNYLKQKQEWHAARGQAVPQISAVDQIKEAARDIMVASQEVAQQQQEEDQALAQEAASESVAEQQPPVSGNPDQTNQRQQPPAPPQQ